MSRWLLVLAVVLALAGAPAVAQVPAVQEVVAAYLTGLPADFNGISAQALKTKLDAGEPIFVLDVREASEFEAAHIVGAINVPIRTLAANLNKLPAKNAPIVALCGVGTRGAYATMTLTLLGYTNVKNLGQGMTGWNVQSFPVVK